MRRRLSLSLALILGFAALLGTSPTLLAEQQCPSPTREGPCEGITGATPVAISPGREQKAPLQAYSFTISPGAFIPEARADAQRPEAVILAQVVSGTLVFRVGPEANVIVDPHGKPITIVEPDPPIDAAHPLNSPHNYDREVGTVTDSAGDCTTLCVIPPDTFVRLDTGYTVYLPGAVTCFWCNATDNADATLLVVASSSFRFEGLAETGDGLRATRAYLRNPGSPCH